MIRSYVQSKKMSSSNKASDNKPVIIIGGGGHASVLLDILLSMNREVIGVINPTQDILKLPALISVINENDISSYPPQNVMLVNGIGMTECSTDKTVQPRVEVWNRYRKYGYKFATVIHPKAIVSDLCEIGEGAQIMAGAIINSGASIGANCIINTGSIVEHHCKIHDHVHIAPNATLCGNVVVTRGVVIGASATLLPGVKITSKVNAMTRVWQSDNG